MDAVFLLENMGLQVSVSGKGKVWRQSLKVGHRIQENEKVLLRLS
jgi:cell division protein FtsI (penicillin-binding protein 3)